LAGLFLQNYLRTLVFGYPKTVYRQNRHHGRGCSECRESSVPLGWGRPALDPRGQESGKVR